MMLSDMIKRERDLYEFTSDEEMEHVGLRQQSSTLFPQRVSSGPISTARVEYNGDNFQYKHKSKSITCSNNNVSETNSFGKSLELSLKTSEQNLGNLPSPDDSLSRSSDSQNSCRPESVICFLCEKEIEMGCIEEHLLIGEVTCVKCSVLLISCQSFQLWIAEGRNDPTSCNHLFQYIRDPLETLKNNFAAKGTKIDTLKRTGNTEYDIKRFLNRIKSLHNKYPWQHAISCQAASGSDKDEQVHHKNGKLKPISKEGSDETFNSEDGQLITVDIGLSDLGKNGPSQDTEDTSSDTCFTEVGIVNNIPNCDPTTKQTNSTQGKNGHSCKKFANLNLNSKTKKRKIVQPLTEPKRKTPVPKPEKSKNYVETLSSGFQSSTESKKKAPVPKPDKSKNCVETPSSGSAEPKKKAPVPKPDKSKNYVETPSSGFQSSTESKKKAPVPKPDKSKNYVETSSSGSTESKKKAPVPKPDKSKNYVETPSSGFYYVVQRPVKECPNCYSAITAPDFTINIVTFLMTAVCSGCGLTIYIVHDPPDDSSPRVCIVTDQKKGSKSDL